MNPGRPSLYTPELAAEICRRLAAGESLRAICRDDGMPDESTVRGWATENTAGFFPQYARAREIQAERWADEILDIADDGSNDWMERQRGEDDTAIVLNHEAIQRSSIRIDTRKWLLARVLPKKYGAKVEIEHGGKVKIEDERREHVAGIVRDIFGPPAAPAADDAGGGKPLVSGDAGPSGGARKRRAR